MMDPSSMIYGALLVGGFEGARAVFTRWLRGQREQAFRAGQQAMLPASTVPESRWLPAATPEYIEDSDGSRYAIVPPGAGVVRVVSVKTGGHR